jgi:hypothetical protein
LVGIIVLVGVLVIATAPKTARGSKVTLDMVKSEAAKADAQIDRLAVRIVDARKVLSRRAAPTDGLDEADRLLAQAREELSQARKAPDLEQGQQSLIDGRQMLRKARRAVEVATKSVSKPHGM